jgi:dTDP-4-amino-4,6-dideoxygalactose transaminase
MREALQRRVRSTLLPFGAHAVGEDEIAEVADTLRSPWITTGPKVKRFEGEFAAAVGAPAALAVNSCTAALHLALVVLGVGPGDQVVTSPMTFCASLNVIEHVGARPLLVDVEPDTLNISPHEVEAAVAAAAREARARAAGASPGPHPTPVKAILPIHLYGHPAEMDALLEIARDHDLDVIEDAAHALPAAYRSRLIGSWAADRAVPRILSCFSFYATKNLTTAEGGMLTGAPELVDAARVWSLHGMSRDAWKRYDAGGSWYYEVLHPGFKYNMTDVQAAIGLHQLRKLDAFQARRRDIVRRYHSAFSDFPALDAPVERPEVEHAWHLYSIRLRTERLRFPDLDDSPGAIRNRFIEELRDRKIGTSVHFIPAHLHPYYRDKYGYRPQDFPVAHREYERLVSLPLHPRMSDDDVDDVIDAVADVLERYRQ